MLNITLPVIRAGKLQSVVPTKPWSRRQELGTALGRLKGSRGRARVQVGPADRRQIAVVDSAQGRVGAGLTPVAELPW